MKREFLNFFRKNNIQKQKIPLKIIGYICENFPSEWEKIKKHSYFLVNFDNEKFRKLLEKYFPGGRIEFGVSSQSFDFVIIDSRLKYPEPMIVHELVEFLKEAHKEASNHEILFANKAGIQGYDKNFNNFDQKTKNDKIRQLKTSRIPFIQSSDIELKKEIENFLKKMTSDIIDNSQTKLVEVLKEELSVSK